MFDEQCTGLAGFSGRSLGEREGNQFRLCIGDHLLRPVTRERVLRHVVKWGGIRVRVAACVEARTGFYRLGRRHGMRSGDGERSEVTHNVQYRVPSSLRADQRTTSAVGQSALNGQGHP